MSEIIQTEAGFVEINKNTPAVLRTGLKAIGRHLTIVESVYYHSHDGRDPVDVTSRFHSLVHSEEAPYNRQLKVEEEWIPLRDKFCWLEGLPSMIVVKNDQGTYHHLGVQPTKEQIEEEELKVLELRFGESSEAFCEIPVEQSIRFKPTNFDKLQIRCRSGKAKFTLTVFPG